MIRQNRASAASLAIGPLNCSFGAPRGIRTPNRQIRSLVLYVNLVGSRRNWPAHVGRVVDPDGSSRVPLDRVDDQPDDQARLAPAISLLIQGGRDALCPCRDPGASGRVGPSASGSCDGYFGDLTRAAQVPAAARGWRRRVVAVQPTMAPAPPTSPPTRPIRRGASTSTSGLGAAGRGWVAATAAAGAPARLSSSSDWYSALRAASSPCSAETLSPAWLRSWRLHSSSDWYSALRWADWSEIVAAAERVDWAVDPAAAPRTTQAVVVSSATLSATMMIRRIVPPVG